MRHARLLGVLLAGTVGGTIMLVGTITVTMGDQLAANYEYAFQQQYGDSARFYVSGPATGGSPDVEGDAILDVVEYADGSRHEFFLKPSGISNIQFSGNHQQWRVRSGRRVAMGLNETWHLGESDGKTNDVTPDDIKVFGNLIRRYFANDNLNNYLDLGANGATFSFVMAFEEPLMDNEPGPDELGEILYFERGTGAGNSWLEIQAVDETGSPLGPALVLSPSETVQTTPLTTVYRGDQKMGSTSIDISRLGVSEVQYLRVSNDVTDEAAYTGGGDLNPDFKIMAVITNERQLAQYLGAFD